MQSDERYLQRLPALDLSIERNTDAVPHDGGFYVIQRGAVLGHFQTLRSAKTLWDKVIAESGWTPEVEQLSPEEMLARDKAQRERLEKEEHWARVRASR